MADVSIDKTFLTIKGITQKGKNRIKNGLGTDVVVVGETDNCIALDNSPAFMIAPKDDPSIDSKYSRWIKKENDKDFEIAYAVFHF